ncbi:MAG: calcium-binding protein [Beijerinckiaceae bacterium]
MPIFTLSKLVPVNIGITRPGSGSTGFVGTDADDTFSFSGLTRSPLDTEPLRINGDGGLNDFVDFSGFTHGVVGGGIVVRAGQSGLTVSPGLTNPAVSILEGIERFAGSDFGDDIAIGDALREVSAGAGNDVVHGGPTGGATIDGGIGADVLAYLNNTPTGAARHMIVDIATGWAMEKSGGAADRLSGFESVTTGRGDDFVAGNALNNGIVTGAGADVITGGRGSDWLEGGDGDDLIFGSDFAANNGDIDIDSLFGGAGHDFMMVGTNAKATLAGGAGNDSIWGGTNNDTITAGSGRDVLGGAGGIDRFEFTEAMSNGDFSYIADFADNAWSNHGDMLVFAASMQGRVFAQDVAGGAYVGVMLDQGSYGIMLAGMTAAGLQDQMQFI